MFGTLPKLNVKLTINLIATRHLGSYQEGRKFKQCAEYSAEDCQYVLTCEK